MLSPPGLAEPPTLYCGCTIMRPSSPTLYCGCTSCHLHQRCTLSSPTLYCGCTIMRPSSPTLYCGCTIMRPSSPTLYCGCTIMRPSSPTLYCGCTIESPPAPVVNVPFPTPPTRSLASSPKLAKSYPAGTRRPSFFGASKTKRFSLLRELSLPNRLNGQEAA